MTTLVRKTALLVAASLSAASTYAALPAADLQGTAMPEAAVVDRTIVVTPATRSINVSYGETVKLVLPEGRQVIWKFDGLSNDFPLNNILGPSASEGAGVPQGKGIRVYIDQGLNPLSSPASD